MSASQISTQTVDPQVKMRDQLREEAALGPDPVATNEPTKETQIIAI